MKIVSYETANKLVDAGVVLNATEKVYDTFPFGGGILISRKDMSPSPDPSFLNGYLPAPTLCELLEVLPEVIDIEEHELEAWGLIMWKCEGYALEYRLLTDLKTDIKIEARHENPAEAAGLLALQLLEKGIALNVTPIVL